MESKGKKSEDMFFFPIITESYPKLYLAVCTIVYHVDTIFLKVNWNYELRISLFLYIGQLVRNMYWISSLRITAIKTLEPHIRVRGYI